MRIPKSCLPMLRGLLPPEYEIVPVSLLRTLADAAWRTYLPAYGGSAKAVENAQNAAQAADNIIARYERRSKEQP